MEGKKAVKGKKKGKKFQKQRKDKVIIGIINGDTGENDENEENQNSGSVVQLLMAKCDMTEEDVVEAYKKFNEENPSGVISREEFLESMQEDQLIAESLFRVFDEDNSGALNFSEYLQVKSVRTVTTAEEKLNWIFTAFDTDGGGSIDVDEIKEIVLGCFRMAGIEEDDEMLPCCVEDVRSSIDVDGDGDISQEEFVKNALKNKFISKLLKYDQ